MNDGDMRMFRAFLSQEGPVSASTTGALTPAEVAAVRQALEKRVAKLPAQWTGWPDARKAVAYLQLVALEKGSDPGKIDGQIGPNTRHAFDDLEHLLEHGSLPPPIRDLELSAVNPNHWPTEAGVIAFYGQPGTNQTMLQLPYRHWLSWDLSSHVDRTSCHVKVHDSLKRVLQRVLDHYGQDRIHELRLDVFGGGFNVRKKKGGTTMSMHSWGIAFDYDPDRNQLKWGRDRASFARSEYEDWWRIWEEEGWVSLGRTRNFDWMHVQAAKL